MPFRDRVPACPRCHVDLARADDDRESWRCPRCGGIALGVGDLIDDLLEVAPHLRPADGIRELVTISRRASADLACPVCGLAMEPVYLAALEIDRCRRDSLVWLARGDRDLIVARAGAQPRSGLVDHVRTILLGPQTHPRPARGSRIASVVSLLAMLAAFPLGLFGALLLALGGASDSSPGGGADGGLAALATLAGGLALVVAAVVFIVGGIVFVRAAREPR
jgi:Zn-finger nucleic acid-binding protein